MPAASDQGFRKPPVQPEHGRVKQPPSFGTAKLGLRFEAGAPGRQGMRARPKLSRSGSSVHFFGAAWALLSLALLRSYHGVAGVRLRRNGLAAVIAGCAIALGGAYLYREMRAGSNDSFRIERADHPLDINAEKALGNPSGKKLTYARLTPNGPVTELPAVPSTRDDLPKPADTGLDNRTDGAISEGKQVKNTPALPQAAVAEGQAANKPTMVRSETYLPDGTRIDVARPAPIPSIVRLGAGRPRPPFLAAAQPPEAAAAPAAAEAPRPPAVALAEANDAAAPVPAAEPAPSLETGYFAQVKADQDRSAAEAELAAIGERYKAVLGEVPLKTRSVDLKEKGVWIRVLAGPLKSRDEAANLCKKLKSAGIDACIVQKLD